MAHIRRHPESPDRWQVRYIDPSGKERSRNFSKKSEAEKFLHTVETDKLRDVWVDPQHGRIAFGDWAAQVEATRLTVAHPLEPATPPICETSSFRPSMTGS